MEENLRGTIDYLQTAVTTMMHPETTQAVRLQAYQMCEEFKETSNECVQCGILMSSKERDPLIRHFGLQLLEHCVKFRWNKMSIVEKKFVKENIMKLITEGTLYLLVEEKHIKDALSRVVVEIIKREWPQQWPSMLSELDSIAGIGATQTELVLLIFLRLAEDILIFQSTPHQRRRDIMQGLTNVMPNLFPFFINTLQSNITNYHQIVQGQVNGRLSEEDRQLSLRLAGGAVETMSAFIDWIHIGHIMNQDGRLLQLLCSMLDDSLLRLVAVECLLSIINRRGKLEDRQPLLILFSADAMAIILNSAVSAATATLEEENYVFLKRLCQVLTNLGSQLFALWGIVKDVRRPPTFHQYLEAMLAFTTHSSLMLCGYTIPLWTSFLKHEEISKDNELSRFIPQLISAASNILIKNGFPSQNNSERCCYSRFDFDSDEEFLAYFTRVRAECADMLRGATSIFPELMFRYAIIQINEQLNKPIDVGDGCDIGHCNLSSPSFLQWDALTVFLECVTSRLINQEKDLSLYNEGLTLLKNVLLFETADPLIRSAILSVISALFPFVVHASDILQLVLDKLFSTAVFSRVGQTKSTRSRSVKNVRRHACSVLVKICKLYPDLLLPGFDQLCDHVQRLSNDPEELSQMEKCTLIEALILISNQNKNFEKQMRFLSFILDPVKEVWLSEHIKEAVWSVDKFIKFVGLDQSPVEPSVADICGINRSQLVYCIISILAVLKRSQCPDILEEAIAGGFMLSSSESSSQIFRNPATLLIFALIDNILGLCRTLNELWISENLLKRHSEFNKAFDLLDIDKMILLGIQPPLTDNSNNSSFKQPLHRMQSFISLLHENCFHILGNAGHTFGYEFYRLPNLSNSLLNSVCVNLSSLPDYRIRPLIRSFLKPFVFWCPKEFHRTALLPLLARIGKLMQERLSSKWETINQRCEESKDNDEENSESQEVLEEQIVRHLTREYLELLGVVFREKKGSLLEVNDEMSTDDTDVTKKPNKEEKIGDLGLNVLQDNIIFPSMLTTIFTSLSWNDTTTCNKAIVWCIPLLKQLLSPDIRLNSDDAFFLLGAVLIGLNMHGQHEALQSILINTAMHVYELLMPEFPVIAEVMLQISSCSQNDLQKFNEIISSNQQKISDKRKKEMFRSLVQDAIGKNIGQQFKKEVKIKNLAPFRSHRFKTPSVYETETRDIGLCSLFSHDDLV